MLRSIILYLSGARWARSAISRIGVARRTAGRFVAGERPEDAITAIRALNARKIKATLDHLGESVTTEAEARRAADDYVDVLDRISASQVCANVSIKLTQMGLDLGEAFCIANARRIVEQAQAAGNFVRIDMEGSAHTEATLRVFRELRAAFDNVGIVLQSYLYRTDDDLRDVLAAGARVRLCKGAYKEPPDVAYPRKADVDAAYLRQAKALLEHTLTLPRPDRNGRWPPVPALATHDERLIEAARAHAQALGLGPECYEFQMLHGIRRDLQDRLAAQGYGVRVYVPYGTEWYPYFMRRLAERPANVWFFLSNLVKQ
jgi:proline dehydrogenase